jgi:hypothetical protein
LMCDMAILPARKLYANSTPGTEAPLREN